MSSPSPLVLGCCGRRRASPNVLRGVMINEWRFGWPPSRRGCKKGAAGLHPRRQIEALFFGAPLQSSRRPIWGAISSPQVAQTKSRGPLNCFSPLCQWQLPRGWPESFPPAAGRQTKRRPPRRGANIRCLASAPGEPSQLGPTRAGNVQQTDTTHTRTNAQQFNNNNLSSRRPSFSHEAAGAKLAARRASWAARRPAVGGCHLRLATQVAAQRHDWQAYRRAN